MTQQKYNDKNGRRESLNKIKEILSRGNLTPKDYTESAGEAQFKLARPSLALGLLMKGNSMCGEWNKCIEYMQIVVFGAKDEDRLYNCDFEDRSRPTLKQKYHEHMANWFYDRSQKVGLFPEIDPVLGCVTGENSISLLESSLRYAEEAGMNELSSKIRPELERQKKSWSSFVEFSRRSTIRRMEEEEERRWEEEHSLGEY